MFHDAGLGCLPAVRWRVIRYAVFVSVTVVLAACQTGGPKALTLEEAKQVTAEFSGSFTPPPRTSNDILSSFGAADFKNYSCEQETPLTDGEVQAKVQSLTFRNNLNKFSFLAGLALREFYKGNYPRSVKFAKWVIDEIPVDWSGRWAALYQAQLSAYQAYAGDFDDADGSLAEAAGHFSQMNAVRRRNSGTEQQYAWVKFHLEESQAAIAGSKGKLAEAEARYRRALAIADESLVWSEWLGFTKLALAKNLIRQGRLLEAENIVRKVLGRRKWIARISPLIPAAMLRFSEVLYEQGRFGDAEAAARITIKAFNFICTAPENIQFTETRNVLAKSLASQERWQEASDQYDAIRAGMANDMDSFERLYAGNLFRALAMLRTGRTKEATKSLRLALRRTEERLGAKHYRAAEIRGFLAMARLKEGAQTEALGEFAAAAKILLTRSRESDDESNTFKARDQRLNLILESYMGLLADIRGTEFEKKAGIEATSEAFRLAETARSRAIQRALAASGSRAALKDPGLAGLARREQDTQKQIAALYGTLAQEQSRPPRDRSLARIKGLKGSIDQLRGARAALIEEIERRFPDYAELINPKPLTIEDARSVLRPGEALVSTYAGRERTFVWAVPHRGEVAFEAVDAGREVLSDTVALLRGALEPNASTLGDIPEFDLGAAYKLYARLLAPVKAGWGDSNSLLVVAHGPLGYLPISILPTENVALGPESEPLFANYRDVPWLARTHAVTMLPSVASLKALRGLPPGDGKRSAFAGFGDPLFSAEQAKAQPQQVAALTARGIKTRGLPVRLRAAPKTREVDSAELALLPRLPDTADEVTSMGLALNADLTASVFLGAAASEDRVKSMNLSGFRVLAFATHGLVPGDLNGLTQPALALTSPKVSGGSEDGLLTMGEILGLKLNADWVVLSACNTGSGEGAGAEAVSGLGRAFFYAGTRALLVSNWPVETTSAKALTTDLFKRQAGDPALTRAEALRRAMVGLIDGEGFRRSGQVVYTYAHPLFWAPFSLIGDGGGGKPGA